MNRFFSQYKSSTKPKPSIPKTDFGLQNKVFLGPQGYRSGERGIRTPGPVTRTQHFQCCTIGRSAISPWASI